MSAPVKTGLCRVCGASGTSRERFEGMLRSCGACGFTWTVAESAPPEELYDGAYFEGDGYEDYYDPRARRFESGLRLRWLLETGRPASLLEAGSAGGFFVEAAADTGIAARGVEVSAAAVDYARTRLGVPVEQGAFESATFAEPFEAVCAFHVLEHVEDPAAFLEVARSALAPGGRVALEVPNIASAAAGRLGSSWPHIQPAYHRWHFTPGSLRRLVEDAGLDVVSLDTVFSRFYWQPWARRLHARSLFVADLVASRRPGVRHPRLGDAIRLVARR